MYRLSLSKGIRTLRPTCLAQCRRRLTTETANIPTQIEELARNTTQPAAGEHSEQGEQIQNFPKKKKGLPVRVADTLERKKLSRAAKAVRSLLVRVDYIPDGATEEELLELFSQYGRVQKVQFGLSNAEQFFGRAHVMFADSSEIRKAWNRLKAEQLTLRGSQLAVDIVEPFAELSETIFVGNISPAITDEDILTTFSKYGSIHLLIREKEKPFAHIVYDSYVAAELAINRSFLEPVRIHDEKVVVGPAHDAPKRILHVAGFTGDIAYVKALFEGAADNIERIRIARARKEGSDGANMAWVTFPTIAHAVAAKGTARKNNPAVSVMYSNLYREDPHKLRWLVPSSPNTQPESSQATPPPVSPNPALVPSVLLVSNVPTSVTIEDLQAFFNEHAPGGVPLVVVPTSNPHVLLKSEGVVQKKHYTALVSLNDPADVSNVMDAHEKSPLHFQDSPLDISLALLDKLEPPTRTVQLDGVIDDKLTPTIKSELWVRMGVYGKLQNIRSGRTPGSVFVRYGALADAINAIMHLSRNPLNFQGHKARANFGPAHLRTPEENQQRKERNRRVAEEKREA